MSTLIYQTQKLSTYTYKKSVFYFVNVGKVKHKNNCKHTKNIKITV